MLNKDESFLDVSGTSPVRYCQGNKFFLATGRECDVVGKPLEDKEFDALTAKDVVDADDELAEAKEVEAELAKKAAEEAPTKQVKAATAKSNKAKAVAKAAVEVAKVAIEPAVEANPEVQSFK